MRRRRLAAYHAAVVAIVADEFGLDGPARDALDSTLARHGDGFDAAFEFICDHPLVANWRLRHDPDGGPHGLRLADSAAVDVPARRDRAAAVTAALRAGRRRL